MARVSKNKKIDLDKTDELPVLSEEAVFEDATEAEDSAEDTGEHETVMIEAISQVDRSAMEHLQRNINDLTEKWSGIEDLLSSNSEAMATLKVELTASREELQASREKQETLAADVAAAKAEAHQASESLKAAETRVTDLEEQVAAAEARATEMQAQLTQAEQDTADAKARADASDALAEEALETATAADARAEAAAQESATAASQAIDAGQRADEAEARAAEAEAQRTDANEHASEAIARAETLATQLEDAEQRASGLAKDLAATEEKLVAAQNELKGESQAREELDHASKTLRARVAELEELQGKPDEEAKKYQAKLDEYRERVTALESYVAGRGDRWEEMERLVGTMSDRIAELETELTQRVARGEELENRLRTEQSLRQEERQKADTLASTLTDRDRELSDQMTELEELRNQQRAADADPLLLTLQDEIVELHQSIANQQQQLAASQDARRELEEQLESARNELDQARQNVSTLEEKLDSALPAGQPESGDPAEFANELEAGVTQLHSIASPSSAAPVLICLTSSRPTTYVIEKPETIIGRSPQSDIQIKTHFVSREHAAIINEANDFSIEDRGSTNGVFVNGIKVDQAPLAHGDWVTIGETQFRFLSH